MAPAQKPMLRSFLSQTKPFASTMFRDTLARSDLAQRRRRRQVVGVAQSWQTCRRGVQNGGLDVAGNLVRHKRVVDVDQ